MDDRFEKLQTLWMDNYIKLRRLMIEIDEASNENEAKRLMEDYAVCKLELDRIDKELSECN